jgi:hypothetical protein
MGLKNYLHFAETSKDRSTMKSLKESLRSFSFPLETSLGVNDYWALLFICCVSLFEHKLLLTIPIYISLKTTKRMAIKSSKKPCPELGQIVSFIKMNHLQSLGEALESNPSLLHCEYKKKNLLSWCEFYNNTKAMNVVSQIHKKYSVEKTPMAA